MCKNEEEINNYIDKLFIYEQNPGKGDYNYLKEHFIHKQINYKVEDKPT